MIPIRVGVAGLGFGARVHVPALRGILGVEVVAIAGRDRARANMVATELNIPTACGSIADLFALQLDAVTIALPPAANAAAVDLALTRGIPVLVEKPLAPTASEAVALAERAHERVAMTDFEFAELPAFRMLRELVASRRYGAVQRVDVHWYVESQAHRERTWSWKTDAARSGGVLTSLGSHICYLAEWIFGPIVRISAALSADATRSFTPIGAAPAEDDARLIFEHVDGIKSAVALRNANPGTIEHRWTVVCEGGTLVLEDRTMNGYAAFGLHEHTLGGRERILFDPTRDTREADWHIAPVRMLASRFISALHTGAMVSPSLAAGARVQALLDAVRTAAARAVPVSLPAVALARV